MTRLKQKLIARFLLVCSPLWLLSTPAHLQAAVIQISAVNDSTVMHKNSSGKYDYIKLVIRVSKIPKDKIPETELTPNPKRLEIYLADIGENDPIVKKIEGVRVNQPDKKERADDFYWESIKETKILDSSSSTHLTFQYEIKLREYTEINTNEREKFLNHSDPSKVIIKENSLKFRAAFWLDIDTEEAEVAKKSELITISYTPKFPTQAPLELETSNSHLGASVSWNATADVAHQDASGVATTLKPSKMVLMFLKPEEGNVAIKAHKLDSTQDSGLSTETFDCTFIPQAENCIDCSSIVDTESKPIPVTIASSQEDQKAVQFFLEENDGSINFSNMELGKTYWLAMQYENGLARTTTCKQITPIETISLSEYNGEEKASLGDPRCFIVSASHGLHDPITTVFRWARDHYLMQSSVGKNLVKWYYKNSPPLADKIAQSKTIKTTIRFILWPLASFLFFLRWLNETFPSCPIFTFLLLGGLLYYQRRKLKKNHQFLS